MLTSYLLGIAGLYLPHSHEHPVVLGSQSSEKTASKKHKKHSHCHHHHHSPSHAHHQHGNSDKACDSDSKQHSHHHHHGPSHSDDDCLLCQFQMQSQDKVDIVTLPPVSEAVTALVVASPLTIHPPLLGISQSRATPIV